jgi:hypothetical protein
MLSRCTATLIALASLSAQGSAQPVLLQIRPLPGDTVHLLLEQTVEMTGMTRVGTRDSTMSSKTSMTIRARAIVLSVDSLSSRILAMTDSVIMSSGTTLLTAPQERARRALQGTRAEMRVLHDGSSQIISDPSELANELRSLIAEMPATLPRTPVQVGESWAKVVTVPIETQGGAVSSASLKTTFRFDSLSRNRDIAYISMSGELSRAAPVAAPDTSGVEMTGTLKGTMEVDRRRGWMTSSHAVIKLRSIVPPLPGTKANRLHFNFTITQRMRALDKR